MSSNSNSIDIYLKKIGEVSLLTADEERDLTRRMKNGDLEAKKRLVESNLRFVVKIAKGYRNQGLPLLDLIQEGNLGLIEAIERFDETLGFRLTTYCSWWIRLSIQRALEQKARLIRVPVNKFESLRKAKSISNEYYRQYGKEISLQELARRMKIRPEKVLNIIKSETSFSSLESSAMDDGASLASTLADDRIEPPYQQILRQQALNRLDSAMDILNPREKKVIQWRFGLNGKGEPASLRKIGAWIGLSAEGVRRIEEQALEKLRRPVIQQRVEGLV